MTALGSVGLWTHALDTYPAREALEVVGEIEALGYGAVWIPETVTREVTTWASMLLDATDRIVVASGIASIWARPPQTAAAAHRTINEAHPGRFVFGLGVSHQPMVEGVLHQSYDKPYSTMQAYLDAMDGAFLMIPEAAEAPRRVLGALGPRMLGLAAERADGAHPYHGPPEHTATARQILGPDRLLCPEQAAVLDTDPSSARATARHHLAIHLGLPNYQNLWRSLGFGDDDFADGGSDRLVDAVFAWGDDAAIGARVQQHLDAGADHVCVDVVMPSLGDDLRPAWRELARAALLAGC